MMMVVLLLLMTLLDILNRRAGLGVYGELMICAYTGTGR